MVIRLPSVEPHRPVASLPVHVLVLDDGLGVLAGIQGVLAAAEGVHVTTASSIAEAEQLLPLRPFDAVLLEPRCWEGDAGYLRPLIENDPRGLAAVIAGHNPRDRRRRSSSPVEAEPRLLLQDGYLVGVVREAVAAMRAARRKQTMLRWLEREAHSDGLTGLHNRAAFEDELADICGLARHQDAPVGLLLVNVVGTGSVNAAYGREAGDEMIRRASIGITQSVQAADFVARLGEDDFAIILPGAAIDLVRRIARRISHNLEWLNTGEWADEIPVALTYGVASGVGCSAERLLAAAEEQLREHGHDHAAPPVLPFNHLDSDGPSVA